MSSYIQPGLGGKEMYRLSELDWGNLGTVYRDSTFDVFGLLDYENAPGNLISFYGNLAFIEHLNHNKKIKCIICTRELVETLPAHVEGIIISDNPLFCFWQMNNKYGKTNRFDFKTQVGRNTMISEKASIASQGVTIGDNVIIEEFVSIKEGTRIGNNVLVRAGAIIGQDCTILSRNENRMYMSSLYGGVIIEDDVYVGSNSVITRGTLEWLDTHIGAGVKIGAFSSISHNVSIGENGVLCDGVLISGDCTIGREVWMSPGTQTTNSITVGNDVSIMLGTIVKKNIDDNMVAVEGNIYRRSIYNAIRRMKK